MQSATLKRSPMKPRTVPMVRTGFARKPFEVAIKAPRLKTTGPTSTAAERRYMGRVAALGCIVCSHCLGIAGTPAIVHHLRTGQGHMRASHYDTMPLCPTHHQDSGIGVHDMGRDEFAAMYGISELDLVVIVKQLLAPIKATA